MSPGHDSRRLFMQAINKIAQHLPVNCKESISKVESSVQFKHDVGLFLRICGENLEDCLLALNNLLSQLNVQITVTLADNEVLYNQLLESEILLMKLSSSSLMNAQKMGVHYIGDDCAKSILNDVCDVFPRLNGSHSLHSTIRLYAGQCIFYLSVMNYNVVIEKIQGSLQCVSKLVHSDETEEIWGVHIISQVKFDRMKLEAFLEIVIVYSQKMRKSGLLWLAISLKRAIWNWIKNYPEEFSKLYENQEDFKNALETFEVFLDASVNSKKRHQYWPFLSSLLICLPVSLSESKKEFEIFLKGLNKATNSKSNKECALKSYIDMLRASSLIFSTWSPLGPIMENILPTLTEKIFNPEKNYLNLSSEGDKSLMQEFVSSAFKFNAPFVKRNIVPIAISESSNNVFRQILVKSCRNLVNSTSIALYEYMASPLRIIFYYSLTNFKKKIDYQNQVEVLLDIFELYQSDPHLIYYNETGALRAKIDSSFIYEIIKLAKHEIFYKPAVNCIKVLFCSKNVLIWNKDFSETLQLEIICKFTKFEIDEFLIETILELVNERYLLIETEKIERNFEIEIEYFEELEYFTLLAISNKDSTISDKGFLLLESLIREVEFLS
ncbi:hypothetical protein O9G_003786, partial [Rozella allomycis CSF55]